MRIVGTLLVPTLRVGTQDRAALRHCGGAPDAEHQRSPFPRRAWERRNRTGSLYIAVLGTALIVALLGMSALIGQRLQNKMITASSDTRQAQLNANTAIELGLLTMKNDTSWRTNNSSGNWFVNRGTNAGTCTLNVTDPIDGNLANNADDPVVLLGIGYSGQAIQRAQVTIDPRKEPLGCLRSAFDSTGGITLQNATLRTGGLITANTISSTSSQVYGSVQATSISGSTYNGSTSTITSPKLPTRPDWTSVFNYYRTNGTQILIGSLPTSTPNLGTNVGFESGTTGWTNQPTGISDSDIDLRNDHVHGGTNSLRVRNRSDWYSGVAQYIDGFVKPGQSYTMDAWVYMPSGIANAYCFTLYTKGTGAVQFNSGSGQLAIVGNWVDVTATITAPSWSGNLQYAFVKIAGANAFSTADFYVDDFTIRENTTGSFIYRQVLSPSLNPFGAQTNSQGIYWINCNNSKLIIERSRILGTLLVVNPGTGSCVNNGPIQWSPAVAGYPSLLVDADTASNANFAINATNRVLSEKENAWNYNPAGAPHDEFGTDSDTTDIYRSSIKGLIAVRNNLMFQNRALVRGMVIAGGTITSTSGELEVEYQQDALLNPPPGFTAPYKYYRRTNSLQKAVSP